MPAAEEAPDPTLRDYIAALSGKAPTTIDVYQRIVRQFLAWLRERPGSTPIFHPRTFTRTAVEVYLAYLDTLGLSISHRVRVKAVLSSFATWLIEEQGSLARNPARGVTLPAQPLLAPRELSPDQRYVFRTLVERDNSPRNAAIFALGYWAGCRVSDVAWLTIGDVHLTSKSGWLTVGHKGGKQRDIDLHNAARRPLYDYLQQRPEIGDSLYVFPSQRSDRLSEAGIHHWFRTLKSQATKAEWELIADITFHDLRHDFAHRVRAAGWTLEEIAYYLGHITARGTPAIQTTARYTQVSRDQIRRQVHRLTD
jgi:site-specific recombinase XerD